MDVWTTQNSDIKKAPEGAFSKTITTVLFFAQGTETLLEAINTAAGINVTLLTSVERVAV